MSREHIIKAVKKRTEDLSKQFVSENRNISDKAKKIEEYINENDFGCQQNQVRNLVSLIIGEELKSLGNPNFRGEEYAMIVYTKESDVGKNKVGDICICLTHSNRIYHVREEKTKTSCMHKTRLRPATDEEIEHTINGLSEEKYNSIFKDLLYYSELFS